MRVIKSLFVFILSFMLTLLVLDRFLLFSEIDNVSSVDFNSKFGEIWGKDSKFSKFTEGFSLNSTNSEGLLNEEDRTENKDDLIKVAFLGDSFVEGFQVLPRNHFISITENQLNLNSHKKYQFYNFGRSGFGIENMYAYYLSYVKQFSPDLVLFFLANGDFTSTSSRGLTLKIRLSNEAELIIDDKFDNNSLKLYSYFHKPMSISPYFSMLVRTRHNFKINTFCNLVLDKFSPFKKIKEETNNENMNNNETFDVPIKTLKILQEMSNDPRIVLVNRTNSSFNTEISTLLATQDIKTIEFKEAYDNMTNQNIDPFYWKATNKNGHWNNSAHKIIAHHLLKVLKQII